MLQTCWKLVLNINKHTYINKEIIYDPLHSRKQTWNPKMEGSKMMFLFIRGDFQVPAVSFRGSRVYLQGNKWVLLCISTSQIFRVKTFLEFTTYKFWGMCQHLGSPAVAGTRRKCLLVKHRKPSGDQNNSTVWLHFFWQSPPIYVIIHLINKTSNHAPWDNYTKACILAFPDHLSLHLNWCLPSGHLESLKFIPRPTFLRSSILAFSGSLGANTRQHIW